METILNEKCVFYVSMLVRDVFEQWSQTLWDTLCISVFPQRTEGPAAHSLILHKSSGADRNPSLKESAAHNCGIQMKSSVVDRAEPDKITQNRLRSRRTITNHVETS